MKKTHILLSIVVFMAVLLAAFEVRAQWDTPAIPQRTCSAGGLAIIDAGANDTDPVGEPTGQFPRLVTCPGPDCRNADGTTVKDPNTGVDLSGQFLRWDFRYTPFPKVSPSLVGVQVASDVGIVAAASNSTGTPSITQPCIGDSSLQSGANDCDSQWIKYPGNSSSTNPFKAYYFTGLALQPRVEGVVVKSGNSVASCLLAGAGKTSLEGGQFVAETQTVVLPACTIEFSLGPTGKVIPGSMHVLEEGTPCTVSESLEQMVINGKKVSFIGPVQFTLEGSCSVCYPLTSGGSCCTTINGYCVSRRTGACIPIPASNPAGSCRAGTF